MKRHDYTDPGAYFITICTYQRQCLFGDIAAGEMKLNELGQLVNVCWQRLPFHFSNLTLDAFVVMPNHVHGILVLIHCVGAKHPVGNVLYHTKIIARMLRPYNHAAQHQGRLEQLFKISNLYQPNKSINFAR